MKRPVRLWRWGAVLTIVAAAIILASQLFRPLRDAGGFDVPTPVQARQAQAAFLRALEGEDAAPQGLVAGPLEGRRGVAALVEADGDCRGRGEYLLRSGAALPLAIVAPHRGSDRNTGTLADQLFSELPAAAAAWNSAPRNPSGTCPGGDPARHETHYLSAFSLAFAQHRPAGRIVQLHGFETAKRESRAAQLADVIVSQGTETPGTGLFRLADCLSVALAPREVKVYPNDVEELGALTNRQGRVLRDAGFDAFVHLEMSAALRGELVENAELRSRFALCLSAGLA